MEQGEQNEQAKLIHYLGKLNTYWRMYDTLVRGHSDLDLGEWREAVRKAEVEYLYAELKLAEMGWRWDQLAYDKETKTYSFPESKAE